MTDFWDEYPAKLGSVGSEAELDSLKSATLSQKTGPVTSLALVSEVRRTIMPGKSPFKHYRVPTALRAGHAAEAVIRQADTIC